MRKLILVAVTLLCSGLWAFAQTSPSSSGSADQSGASATSGQSGSSSSTGSMGSSSASGQMGSTSSSSGSASSFEGCLTGAAGSYTLKDKATGTTYNLSGADTQLAKHVNEEVRVSGSPASGSSASSTGSSASASSTPSSSGSSSAGGQTLQVTSVTKVASSCSNQ